MEDKFYGYKVFSHDIEKGAIFKCIEKDKNGDIIKNISFSLSSPFDDLGDSGLFVSGKLVKFARVSAPIDCAVDDFGTISSSEIMIEEVYELPMLLQEQLKRQLYDSPVLEVPYLRSHESYVSLSTNEHYAKIASDGYRTHISSSGYHTQMICDSRNLVYMSASGPRAIVGSIADSASVSVSGCYAKIISVGAYTTIAVSGDNAEIVSRGKCTAISVGQFGARVEIKGERSRIALNATSCLFKGVKGTYVTAISHGKRGGCRGFINGRIGEDGLKPDTWYTVKDGKFSEPIEVTF